MIGYLFLESGIMIDLAMAIGLGALVYVLFRSGE